MGQRGPDGIMLQDDHRLNLLTGVDGKLRHLTLTNDEGVVLVEMSGEIVVDVDPRTIPFRRRLFASPSARVAVNLI